MAQSTQISLDAIEVIVRRIVEEFHPYRVILFGSQARGEAKEGSDIDICVVLDTKGQPNHEVARKIQQAVCELAPKVPCRDRFVKVPIQVHVFALEEFEASLLRTVFLPPTLLVRALCFTRQKVLCLSVSYWQNRDLGRDQK
ncbi:MAG: nucleotidyltransferase domain-containing protein [Armatimonadota bacterium]|nr:nucleotidyltransferase domain-containing protein [Armatimonadota bacterium]